MGVAGEHEVDAVFRDFRQDVGFVRHEKYRFLIADGLLWNSDFRARLAARRTSQADDPEAFAVALERNRPILEDGNPVARKRVGDQRAAHHAIMVAENRIPLRACDFLQDLSTGLSVSAAIAEGEGSIADEVSR